MTMNHFPHSLSFQENQLTSICLIQLIWNQRRGKKSQLVKFNMPSEVLSLLSIFLLRDKCSQFISLGWKRSSPKAQNIWWCPLFNGVSKILNSFVAFYRRKIHDCLGIHVSNLPVLKAPSSMRTFWNGFRCVECTSTRLNLQNDM